MGMAIHYHLGQLANEDYSLNKQMKRKKKLSILNPIAILHTK